MTTTPDEVRLSLKPSGRPGEPLVPTAAPRSPRRRPWYARSWVLATAVVILGGGAAVLGDLPHHVTKVQQVKEAAAVVKAVDSSIRPCAYAAAQAFAIQRQYSSGVLDASERAQVPGLLSDDAKACSFTNTSVALLGTEIFGTLTLSSTPAGRDLTAMVKSVLEWEATDAQGAIDSLRTLVLHPGEPKALAQLHRRERFLTRDHAAADRSVERARRALGTSHVPLPAIPDLPTH